MASNSWRSPSGGWLTEGTPASRWAELRRLEAPRAELHRLRLELLHGVIEGPERTGDLDGVVQGWQRVIELDRLDSEPVLRMIEALLRQGRRGAAHGTERAALERLAADGIPPDPELAVVARQLGVDRVPSA